MLFPRKLLVVLAALLVSFLVLEGALRLAVFLSAQNIDMPTIAEFDPELGWSYIPNSNSWEKKPAYFDNSQIVYSNETVDVNINGFGFRDEQWQLAKPAGEKRIAFLGDSYVFGRGIAAEERFSELVETAQCQALNFGVSGYSTDQELLLAQNTVFGFQPDIIVLGLFLGNDIEDNAVPLPANTKTEKPYFVLSDNALELKNYPVGKGEEEQRQTYFLLDAKRWLSQNVYSYSFVVSLLRSIPFTNQLLVGAEKTQDFSPALNLTIAIVEELKKEAEEHNAELIVLLIPSPNQLSKSDDKRNDWVPHLKEAFQEKGIAFIDLLAEFKKSPGQHFYFVSDEHFDDNGNKKVAELLQQYPLFPSC